jgi:hypothetical protein
MVGTRMLGCCKGAKWGCFFKEKHPKHHKKQKSRPARKGGPAGSDTPIAAVPDSY